MSNEKFDRLLDSLEVIFTSIWFWLGIALLVFIFVFRAEISDFLKRLKQFKIKNFEVNTEKETRADEELPKNEELAQEEDEEKQPEVKKIEEPKNVEEWRMEMIFSTFEKNQTRTDEAFLKLQELNTDPISRKKDELLYLKFSHTAGKTDAIQRIRAFLTDTEVQYDANMALGFCYANSEDFENAEKFYSQALEKTTNEEEKTSAAVQLASSMYRNDKKEGSLIVLSDILSTVDQDENKVKLYESLADIYEKENDYENRAFVLDKAVELKPNDTGLIFKVGYSYAESNYDELSLLHYKNACDINPNDEAVQNNLGVQYDNLKMPIKSISSYRKAEKLGNTLASANLAYRLLNAGFTDEAKSILEIAAAKEDIHPNVNSALSDLSKHTEKETEIEKEKIKKALSWRKFFLSFTEAKYKKGTNLSNTEGKWAADDKDATVFELSTADTQITGLWKETLLTDYGHQWKFEGEIVNNSSVLTVYEKEYNFSKSEYEYRKKGKGYLFCSNDGNTIKIIRLDDSFRSKKIYTLTRNSVG